VVASHHDPGTAYVTFTGYRNDDFRPFVYRTTDFGETWTSIASNMPDGPINVIREHHANPDLLVVGTEFAVFVSIDGGANWTRMKNNMPTQPVHDLVIHPREDDIVAATHGRGIYIADISALTQLTAAVLDTDAHFFQPESKVRWIASDWTNYASSNFPGESEPMAVPLYYHLGAGASDVTFTVYQGQVPIAELEGEGDVGLHKVLWRMDRREERSEEEMEQMRERFARFGREVSDDELRYTSSPAPVGTYRVVMSVDGREVGERRVEILKDEWWMQRR
jgi:hypothetical protein